jgi:hypothetical protein
MLHPVHKNKVYDGHGGGIITNVLWRNATSKINLRLVSVLKMTVFWDVVLCSLAEID